METADKNDENDHVQRGEDQALSDIVTWSEERALWQRDALLRLCKSAELTPADIEELFEICKGTTGKAQPISHAHVRNPKVLTKKVELKSIYDVENVNALAVNQKLQFCVKGITVVYGDNGTGKSGYTRILKQICRAREPKTAKILPNIYGTQTESMKAQISFVAAGQNETAEWIKNPKTDLLLSSVNPLLSSISIFDSSTANIYVNDTNEVAYAPFPIALLGKLVEACKSIKNKIQTDINDLTDKTPNSIKFPKCHHDTVVGKAIAGLKANTDPQIIETLAKFGTHEKNRLEQLQSDLSDDPAIVFGRLNAKLNYINTIYEKKEKLSSAITTEQQDELKNLHNEYKKRKNAVELAACVTFKEDPLPGVGGFEWEALWESARRYSEDGAYVGKTFPVANDGSHCVLCQQTLDTDAKKRLERFETFVADDTKRQEQLASSNLQQRRSLLSAESPSLKEISEFVSFCKDDLNNNNLAKEIRAFFIKGKWRLRALLKLLNSLPDVPVWPKVAFDAERAQISKRVSDLTAGDTDEARKMLNAEKTELEDKKWLDIVKNDVLDEIERKKKIDHLSALIKKETATKQITEKSTNISKSLITERLIEQFDQEVNKMKLTGLAVELKQEPSKDGAPQLKVSLAPNSNAKVGKILSEGEFRCIALAAFLAELAATQSKSGIVFDDPVSSLDHMYREVVAARLAAEALTRQVIVFTHDIHFLFLLGQFCGENGTEIQYRHVTKRPSDNATGICHNDLPPKAQDVTKRIKCLNSRLENEKYHYQKGNETEWNRTVHSLQGDIRITWERAVEDFVGEVLTRFGNKVNTKGLVLLTELTREDCKVMREAYGRCSSWLHSSGVGLDSNLPSDDDIKREIDALEIWYDGIRQNQRAIKMK